MKVPFVSYSLQYRNIKEEIDLAIKRVLENGDLILRSDVDEFERKFAEFVGTKYAVGVNSCSDALMFSLIAAGVQKGDEVITVSHTFFATIEAIHHVGAVPVLVDVGKDYLMDMELVEKAITERTKVIIPVHLNGKMCDMQRLTEITKRHNLSIVEDAAQALGAGIERKAGSIGLAGCFSFYPAKILGCLGDGGAVVTNDEQVADKIRLLRNHGQKTKTDIVCYGFTSRLHNLQAAVLNVKMKHLLEWISKRKEIAKEYNRGLENISNIKLPSKEGVFQNYVIRAERRNELHQFLKDNGIETLIKDPVCNHLQNGLNLSHFKLPFSEQLAEEVISLPMYPELTQEQVQYVISKVKEFYV